jgi:chemosensory pili system protein ChpA (sensor histidine kinase/response regulator)
MSKIDPGTLGWVKAEIDETLKQARLALESVAEHPSDTTSLRFCNTYLHQVLGTLQMVELDGAAMLARENEALAESILNGKAEASPAVFEILVRGILSLPDYLARLADDQPDVPLRLLPVINELRAARGAEAIAELDLFSPDLSVRPPARPGEKRESSEEAFAAAAKSLRHNYQLALLGWLRDPDSKENLSRMAELLSRLEHQAHIGFIEQLFWVAGGLLDALVSHDLQPTVERKKLLGRVDRMMKNFIDGGEKAQQRSTSESLVKAMLFQLGEASSSGGKVGQIRRAFDLDTLITGEAAVEIYDMPTPEALHAVSNALGKEIESAQEMLTAYFDDSATDEKKTLEPLIELLKKMSGTLGMLNIAVLKALVDELVEVCRGVDQGRIEKSEAVSMPMAGALLLIEGSSRDFTHMGRAWKKQIEESIASLRRQHSPDASLPVEGMEISSAALSENEFKQLLAAVAGEIRVNLTKVEEALETFAANLDSLTQLESVPGYLNQIQGALQIIGQEPVAEMTAVTNQAVQDVLGGVLIADNKVLDALAVAVGTIGAYIEGLERDRTNLDALLSVAWRELDSARSGRPSPAGNPTALIADIRQKLGQWLDQGSNYQALSILQQDLRDIGSLAGRQSLARLEKISNDMNTLLGMVVADPEQLTDAVRSTLRQSTEILANLAREQLHAEVSQESEPPASIPAFSVEELDLRVPEESVELAGPVETVAEQEAPEEDDFDAEIMEIFVEDAREMLQIINRMLPQWQANPENRDALLEVRRAFHTLKGSGRMVGASTIAELAWAFENMLNRLREGKISHSVPMFELLRQVEAALPDMIAHLEGGPAPQVDVAALQSNADILSRGGEIDLSASEPQERSLAPESREQQEIESIELTAIPAPPDDTETDVTEDAETERPQTEYAFDPVLLQIFSGETYGHLATLYNEAISFIDSGQSCRMTENLLRVAHTLQGSARALDLQFMAECCAEMEKLFQAHEARQQPLSEASLALLQDAHARITELIDVLNAFSSPSAELRAAFHRLAQDLHHEAVLLSHQEKGAHETAHAAAPPASRPHVTADAPPASRMHAPAEEIREDVDPELLEIFMEEAVDILTAVDEALNHWRADRSNQQAIEDLKRSLHTLKGGARMAGAMTMGNLGHNTETLLKEVEDGHVSIDSGLLDLLDEVHDALANMVEQMQSQRPVTSVAELNAKVMAKAQGKTVVPAAPSASPRAPKAPPPAEPEPAEPAPAPAPMPAPMPASRVGTDATGTFDDTPSEEMVGEDVFNGEDEAQELVALSVYGAEDELAGTATVAEPAERRVAPEAADAAVEGSERRGQIRVRTSLLNNLVNYAGEVSISRSRMQQQIFGFRENMAELNRNVTRFRDQIRELEIHSESQILFRTEESLTSSVAEFDPLEFDRFSRLQQLSRGLAESLHDLYTIQSSMDNFVGQAETVLQQQARVNTELQEGLMRTRMVSFSTQAARLRHMVRQTSRELGKQVELEFSGNEVEVDRTVLERMVGPFEHMIRNAIDHGIESEDVRKRRGKPVVGKIKIATSHEGTEIVIRFSDDGAGLDIEAIRDKAIERGLLEPGTQLSDEEVMQFILVAGFSTAKTLTHLSGRGVGMDVVHTEVKQLGGIINVETASGVGTTFTVRLPLTLSITQALMVYAGENLYAVPLSAVINLLEVPVDKLKNIHVGKKPFLSHNDEVYPFMNLAQRLGTTPLPRTTRKVPVLLARSGSRQVAIQIDGLAGTREVVVKSVGPQLSHIEGLAGATILGDGSVVLILDVPGLWITEDRMQVTVKKEDKPPEKPVEKAPKRPVVMVVDDSITVRKVTSRYLSKHSIDVIVAKDGLDAVEQLRERIPDVMLVDIEMPRMDGYELTSNVRSDPGLKHIPIIMITSRSGSKHRDRAMQLGVNLYMTKPYQEEELLKNINAMLARNTKR